MGNWGYGSDSSDSVADALNLKNYPYPKQEEIDKAVEETRTIAKRTKKATHCRTFLGVVIWGLEYKKKVSLERLKEAKLVAEDFLEQFQELPPDPMGDNPRFMAALRCELFQIEHAMANGGVGNPTAVRRALAKKTLERVKQPEYEIVVRVGRCKGCEYPFTVGPNQLVPEHTAGFPDLVYTTCSGSDQEAKSVAVRKEMVPCARSILRSEFPASTSGTKRTSRKSHTTRAG